jgi:quercetin dioxygenase-like cupin family protein
MNSPQSTDSRVPVASFAPIPAAVLCAAALTLLWTGSAQATAAKDFSSDVTMTFVEKLRVISEEELDSRGRRREDATVKLIARNPSDLYIVTNTVLPGGFSGWHTHPGPSVVLVKSGTATVYEGDDPSCAPLIVPAGGSFIDAGGTHVHMVRNESATQTLVTLAFQVMPAGAARRIDAPSPGNCAF